jgi:hypothetical protein
MSDLTCSHANHSTRPRSRRLGPHPSPVAVWDCNSPMPRLSTEVRREQGSLPRAVAAVWCVLAVARCWDARQGGISAVLSRSMASLQGPAEVYRGA